MYLNQIFHRKFQDVCRFVEFVKIKMIVLNLRLVLKCAEIKKIRRQKRKLRYIKENKCVACGKGKQQQRLKFKTCSQCAEKNKLKQKLKQNQYKQEDKCIHCGESKEEERATKVSCLSCALKHRKQSHERRERYKKEHKCFNCGQSKEPDNYGKNCHPCLKSLKKSALKSRNRKKEKGICTHCLNK